MDLITNDNRRDDIAARNRFEAFKLGNGLGPSKHTHSRSHSRNASISSLNSHYSSSISKPTTTTAHDFSSFSFPAMNSSTPTPLPLPDIVATVPAVPTSKRNSHHRRRSSVSTRHESAEMMGVSLPDLPLSTSEDNINLGEKDSIRRRALWALEGKPDVSFNKVEIPELTTPDIEKLAFDFPTKSSYPAGSGTTYGNGLGTLLGNKRDSFKLLAVSSSSKDQLHTLVEEEEEEEEQPQEKDTSKYPPQESLPSPASSVDGLNISTPEIPAVATKPSTRHRPANLNLRPLSLTPDNLVTTSQCLPTPSPTPSPRNGLRSLSLNPFISGDESASVSPIPSIRKPSSSINLDGCDNNHSQNQTPEDRPLRRSSICYKRSPQTVTTLSGLPTPEMTPTFKDRRFSLSESVRSASSIGFAAAADDEFFPAPPTQTRPLSASEQHFLFKSHNALLARITDLERALSLRSRESGNYSAGGGSRPVSVASSEYSGASDYGSSTSGEPSDEMLRLIADLKAERDELKRDVDGWRKRVADLEKQIGVVTSRVENERREAWVARSRAGLLEVEKGVLAKRMEGIEKMLSDLEGEKGVLGIRVKSLEEENKELTTRVWDLEAELENVKQELENEKKLRAELEAEVLATPTANSFETRPRPVFGGTKRRGTGFTSVDSQSSTSTTDVEPDSFDGRQFKLELSLNAVVEVSDEDGTLDGEEEENGLAGYEDEGDEDLGFQSSSSFGSEEEFVHRSTTHLQKLISETPKPSLSQLIFTPKPSANDVSIPSVFVSAPHGSSSDFSHPTHVSCASLSKTWTFPRGVYAPVAPVEDETDRFFGCLEDADTESSGGSAPASPSSYSYERSKSIFSSGLKSGTDDEDALFFLPNNFGPEAIFGFEEIEEQKRLPVVLEEDEEQGFDIDDGEMFGEIGGIKITFTPPQEEDEDNSLLDEGKSRDSLPHALPALNFEQEGNEEDDIFSFGRSLSRPSSPTEETDQECLSGQKPELQKSFVHPITPPSSIPRPASPRIFSTSSIPRPVSPKSALILENDTPSKSPSRPNAFASSAYVTPPTKRGGALPSFIPQPISSPSPIRVALAPSKPTVSTSTFIRQPTRKPLIPAASLRSQNQKNQNSSIASVANVDLPMNTRSSRRCSDNGSNDEAAHAQRPQLTEITGFDSSHDLPHTSTTPAKQLRSYDYPNSSVSSLIVSPTFKKNLSQPLGQAGTTSSFTSLMSSPITTRLSTLTSFLPLSWGARSVTATAAVSPYLVSEKESQSGELPIEPPAAKSVYVTREKQLQRLRLRMKTESKTQITSAVGVHCRKCDGGFVLL